MTSRRPSDRAFATPVTLVAAISISMCMCMPGALLREADGGLAT